MKLCISGLSNLLLLSMWCCSIFSLKMYFIFMRDKSDIYPYENNSLDRILSKSTEIGTSTSISTSITTTRNSGYDTRWENMTETNINTNIDFRNQFAKKNAFYHLLYILQDRDISIYTKIAFIEKIGVLESSNPAILKGYDLCSGGLLDQWNFEWE